MHPLQLEEDEEKLPAEQELICVCSALRQGMALSVWFAEGTQLSLLKPTAEQLY
jgi:hypothetical protein